MNAFPVILSVAKDLIALDAIRSFATLRMTAFSSKTGSRLK
jgi:hypothetical protein